MKYLYKHYLLYWGPKVSLKGTWIKAMFEMVFEKLKIIFKV